MHGIQRVWKGMLHKIFGYNVCNINYLIQGNFSRERPPGRVQFVKLSVKYLCVNLILLGIVSK